MGPNLARGGRALQQRCQNKTANEQVVAESCVCVIRRGLARAKVQWRTCSGGAKRVRTADPLLAKQVLYQLSYGPL